MTPSIAEQLAAFRERNLFRSLRHIESAQGPELILNGRSIVNFSSNDYLGLASELFLREAARRAIADFGVGSGASRLVCGTMSPHLALEEKLAAFKRTEAALSFSTGYAMAVGTITALCGHDDVIILDKLSHASLIDGARLSGAAIRIFPHNHLGKLESHLGWAREHSPHGRILVVTESVFSMDGDRAPLEEIVEIKNRHGALLLIDEAHAVGVIGENGRGLADRLGVAAHVDLQMGTLSKALGVAGGYLCGTRALIDLLINRARSFIYSTAPPPAFAAAASAAIDFLMSDEGEARRRQLHENIRRVAAKIPRALAPKGPLQSAIIPLMVGDEALALDAAAWLEREGILIPAIRYPTVAKGTARLRLTMSAAHTPTHIDALAIALHRLAEKMPARHEAQVTRASEAGA